MTTTKLDQATIKAAIEGPARMRAALAALPTASEAMRNELARWMEMVTPTEGGAPTADVRYGAGTDAEMVYSSWRISAGVSRMRPGLDAYFADFGAKDDEAAFLDSMLEMLEPQRLGIWIEMGNNEIDTGWFFDEPFDFSRVFAAAGGGGGGKLAQKTMAWAERHDATRTDYFARSLASEKPAHDIILPVRTFDAALELWNACELPEANGLVEDALRHGTGEGARAGISMRVNDTGLARMGMLARRPSTDAVLRLIRTRDVHDAKLLARFKGMLAVKGAEWAEYAVYSSHQTDAVLYFTLGCESGNGEERSDEGPARMQAALAVLPSASQAMRDELGLWMEIVTPTEGDAPTADVKYGASTDAAMVTTTWRISAGTEPMRSSLEKYLAEYGIDDGEAERLAASLEMLAPQRAGMWIELANNERVTGWFLDEPVPLTAAFAVAGGGGEFGEKAMAWAERHGVTHTEYVARGFAANMHYQDVFLAAPTIDAALELLTIYELQTPSALVVDALRRGSAGGAGVSVRVTETEVVRAGVLARRPSTDAVLSLIRAHDEHDAKLLAVFEGLLAVNGPDWAQFEIRSGNRTNVELHFTLA